MKKEKFKNYVSPTVMLDVLSVYKVLCDSISQTQTQTPTLIQEEYEF